MGAGASAGVTAAAAAASDAELKGALSALDADGRKKLQDAIDKAGGSPAPATEAAAAATPAATGGKRLVFQLGTNNWQRQGEFAPGSGILHEAHHAAYNEMDGVKCYSIYPSKNQTQPGADEPSDFRIFQLTHDIPICESISPVSNYRWHGMSEDEFSAYIKRLEDEVYDFMKASEKEAGGNFSLAIAHHSFVNPVALRNVLRRRKEDGCPPCPLYCFVHGTALKMYKLEMKEEETDYPLRFHKWMLEQKIFEPAEDGITGCFAISNDQKVMLNEVFPTYPGDRVIISPNGVNQMIFKPPSGDGKTLAAVLEEHTKSLLFPEAVPTAEVLGGYKQMIVFVGKFANWKRLGAVLEAAALWEKEHGDSLCTICVGSGPEEDIKIHTDIAKKLELKHTYLIGAKPQPVLAELFAYATLGIFPSYREPFGMVFIECMACGTPTIGCNSGGPIDFVNPEVGELVPEPPEDKTYDLEGLGATLNEVVTRALKEDWKKTKGPAALKLAEEKYSVRKQVRELLSGVDELAKKLAA